MLASALLALLLAAGPAAALAAAALVVRRLGRAEGAVLAVACAAFALSAALSPVSYVHDHFTHFRHARGAWDDPYLLLDLWDRPAFMLLYAGPARLGLFAARLASLVPAAVALAATMLAARAAGLRRPWLAGVLVAVQYDFFGQASSTMTELLLAAGLAVACWGFLEDRPWLAAAGLAFGGLSRPEAPVVVGACALALALRHRRLGLALAVAAPFLAYLALGSAVHADPLWVVHGNPYRDSVGLRLEAGQLLHSWFYTALWDGQPLPLLLLELAGAALVLREGGLRALFLLGPLAALFLLLTFLRIGPFDWWRQTRYLVSVTPLLALLAARAHADIEARVPSPAPLRGAAEIRGLVPSPAPLRGAAEIRGLVPRLAAPALLAAAAGAAAAVLARSWRPLVLPGSPVIPLLFAGAFAAAFALALLAAGRRVPPAAALAALLALPLVLSPPGTFGQHRPTPGERAAEQIVRALAVAPGAAVAFDHASLEPVCAELLGDAGQPCPLPLRQRAAPAPGDRLFVKQYDGTAPPPPPPDGWRQVWRAAGPRIEGPLLAPVSWTSTTMIWEREPPAG